ncbi:lysine--tRNA ligase [Zavarzinia sp. CC-PAN008]|uniref:lysine--tRNA ligase n=1 Tax=Zavarzinia sp. CC-PAN008 TaxID=3243332 RepID=UPI003F74544E
MTNAADLHVLASDARAWPFEEARKLIARLEKKPKDVVLFETGYGPSGLPHIGTFGEVARTTMVRHAFRILTDDKVPTRLLCFSDDVDGMRKVPENVPNREMMLPHLGKPLTRVPDPFGQYESFGHHNNAMLRRFLDTFGFDYEFASALDYYTSGRFDDGLIRMLETWDKVMAVMLPTLREERRKTYAPLLPLHPETGVVMQVPIEEVHPGRGTVVWTDPDTGKRWETSVKAGGCKAQWKPDWALRWAVLDVDYEMSGKDHIDNVKTSGKICRILGGTPPDGFNYELFLDENGEKISKSRGNGLTIDEWLTYAPAESLSLFMFTKPKTAKKLYFDVIPRAVDDYNTALAAYPGQAWPERLENPVWHIHGGQPPQVDLPVTFALLLNLVGAAASDDKAVTWGFITRTVPGATPQNHPELDRLVGYAIAYYRDFVAPTQQRRAPSEAERAALADLATFLEARPADSSAEALQNEVYEVGKRHGFTNLRDWFKGAYEVLFGQSQGPRLGSFIALYGPAETAALIRKALAA